MPMVRRATAANIDKLAHLIEPSTFKDSLLPTHKLLMGDKLDSVKIKAIESSLNMISIYKDQGLIEDFMKVMREADERKISWRIRYALAETLTEVAKFLPIETVKTDVFQLYKEFLSDKE